MTTGIYQSLRNLNPTRYKARNLDYCGLQTSKERTCTTPEHVQHLIVDEVFDVVEVGRKFPLR